MYLEIVKSNGKHYFYIYAYDSERQNLKKCIYKLGERSKALNIIEEWKKKNRVPSELLMMGLEHHNIENWKNRILNIS